MADHFERPPAGGLSALRHSFVRRFAIGRFAAIAGWQMINVAVGWMWLKMASAERGTPTADLRALHARFFAAHVLADSDTLARRAMLGAALLEEAAPERLIAW